MGGLARLLPLNILAEYLIKSSLVLLAALVLAALCRKRSAALRHFILALFLGGLLFLPFFSRVPGGWTTSLLPAIDPPVLSQAPALTLTAAEPKAGETMAVDDSISMKGVAGSVLEPVPDTEPKASSPNGSPARPRSISLPAGWPALAWFAGAFLVLLRLGLGLTAAHRLTREGRPMADPAWRVLFARFMAAVSLKRKVRLRSHSRVSVPFTWGLVRPVVLMPVETESWSEDERSTALYHELSHIKRIDFLIMLLVRLSLAVYWLNPLTWVVFGALRREQEKACDELVLRAGIKPSTYAENLLRFRRRMGRGWSPAVALLGLFGKPQLSERLAAILKYRMNFSEVKMKTKLMLVCIVVLALVLIGMARPATSTTDKTPKAPKAPAATAATPTASPSAALAPAAAAATAPEAAEAPEAVETPTAQTAPAAAEAQQEPEKEKKAKAATEPDEKAKVKKIIIEPKSGEKGQIEIIVTGGDKAVKKIIVDKPVVFIRTDSADKPILVTSDGKEIKLESGAEIRFEVRDGTWAIQKEGKVLKLDKGVTYYIAQPALPELGIPVAIAEAAPTALMPPAAVAEPAAPEKPGKAVTYVIAPAHKHDEGDMPHVSIEETPEPDVVTWFEKPAVPGKTKKVVTWTAAPARVSEPHAFWVGVGDKDLAQKLKQVREQLKQVKEKKLSLDEVDKSLAEIEESLKKHEVKLKDMAIAIAEPPARIGELPHAEAVPPVAGVPVPPDKNIYIVKVNDKDKFEVIYVGKSGEISKDRFEKVVARIRKELPSGFTLESMFEEESGKVTFTIKSAQPGTGEVNVIVDKLTKIIKDAMKEEGPKK